LAIPVDSASDAVQFYLVSIESRDVTRSPVFLAFRNVGTPTKTHWTGSLDPNETWTQRTFDFQLEPHTERTSLILLTSQPGTLELGKSVGVNAIAGPLVIDSGIVILSVANQIADTSPVTVSNGGALSMNSLTETIGSLTLNNGDVGGGGTLTLGGDVSSSGAGINEILSFVNLGGATRTFTVADLAAFPIEMTINGAISNGGLTKAGAGTLRLVSASSSYTGATTVDAGTLLVQGNISGSATVRQDGPNAMVVKGCAVLGLFCKEQRWTRVS